MTKRERLPQVSDQYRRDMLQAIDWLVKHNGMSRRGAARTVGIKPSTSRRWQGEKSVCAIKPNVQNAIVSYRNSLADIDEEPVEQSELLVIHPPHTPAFKVNKTSFDKIFEANMNCDALCWYYNKVGKNTEQVRVFFEQAKERSNSWWFQRMEWSIASWAKAIDKWSMQ